MVDGLRHLLQKVGRFRGSLGSMERIVTIFGGSKCGEESEEYAQARRVGQLLAEAGFTICTGGYLGVMEAASRGAHERGGRVLGIVMNQFKAEPNRYLTDKVASAHFYERLQNLIMRSVGFIAKFKLFLLLHNYFMCFLI